DNGIGMSEDELKLLFQPFYSKKRNTTGTGLGLPVSRGIIQAHQGRIEIDSKVDKGTSVTIILKV
ncbi:MAG: HAMP domain-containing histidine kinase, partial [Flavobacteriales bacterium]|nr:HAMP domain-containing histidine kinase [Flavobacteriales bacterium]